MGKPKKPAQQWAYPDPWISPIVSKRELRELNISGLYVEWVYRIQKFSSSSQQLAGASLDLHSFPYT
jgi:hypothetical protein